jgi:hypothetical protein
MHVGTCRIKANIGVESFNVGIILEYQSIQFSYEITVYEKIVYIRVEPIDSKY